MITTDPIARIIDGAAAQGFELRRASELQPEAATVFSSGEFEGKGMEMLAAIEKVLDQCEGHDILCPDKLEGLGLPAEFVAKVTRIFESDFSRPTSTLFVEGRAVNQLRGVAGLDLLWAIAKEVDADTSRCCAMGRGTQADQLKEAITEQLQKSVR